NCPVAYQGLKITTSLSSVSMIFSEWWLTPEEEALRAEILGYPDNNIVLEVFEFTADKTGEVLSNRTIKMTNSEIINELPESIITNRSNQMAVKKVLKGSCGRTPKSVRSKLCCLNDYKHCFMNPLPLYV
ncbi:hypothetical protein, partial [Bathymodiolus platifrons methanotrophic gill symbiont]|uniref:hypothetical protein n=1 Tax=Bathymodiolus platifrons methanotrophic gill symbiont TaxID=113268 RepID=UPI001C8D7597